ncbi:MAG: hypothetical protein CL840_11775 [Crocinitomicaceae bacterium]|nr:hypothetical protein [Crocinitomicaceae bacterium]|tara:strand:- start:7236 stop:7448 length:213 start_codon:yes stop_codon:yes gene_type:complete
MGRPPTRPKALKDGYYIEVRNKGTKSGVKIRRDSEKQMNDAVNEYRRTKEVTILGESKKGKFLNPAIQVK